MRGGVPASRREPLFRRSPPPRGSAGSRSQPPVTRRPGRRRRFGHLAQAEESRTVAAVAGDRGGDLRQRAVAPTPPLEAAVGRDRHLVGLAAKGADQPCPGLEGSGQLAAATAACRRAGRGRSAAAPCALRAATSRVALTWAWWVTALSRKARLALWGAGTRRPRPRQTRVRPTVEGLEAGQLGRHTGGRPGPSAWSRTPASRTLPGGTRCRAGRSGDPVHRRATGYRAP